VLVDSAGLDPNLSLGVRLLTLPLLGELLLKPSREKTRQALVPFFYDDANLTDRFADLNYDLITQPGARRAYLSTVRHLANIFGLRAEVAHATTDRLDHVQQRTLIIWGEQDAIVPVSHGRAAEVAIPDANLCVIETCGHLPMLERADLFNQALTAFLAH
jgi:pimeloyl-ACP methyl ester carboxylesterase